MLSNCTVVLRSVVTTTDDFGDSTTETTESTLDFGLIAGRGSTERVDPRSPAVMTAATIYAGPFDSVLNADDILIVSNHSSMLDGEWQAEGIAIPWSLGEWRPGFEVAVKRVG